MPEIMDIITNSIDMEITDSEGNIVFRFYCGSLETGNVSVLLLIEPSTSWAVSQSGGRRGSPHRATNEVHDGGYTSEATCGGGAKHCLAYGSKSSWD